MVTGYSGIGPTSDYYTAKYAAADGALLWEKRYNGPANSYDYASAMALDGSGNVVVTGTSVGTGGNEDYYTAKYAAADGALLWDQRYNGPTGHDGAQAVAVDGSGNVAVTGHSGGSENMSDYYTAKYAAADGTLLWEKRYNGPAHYYDGASAVAVDSSGNVVVTGSSSNTNGYPGYPEYYTAKYAAADGALLWEKRYPNCCASSLALGPNGMVAVTGSSTVVYRENLPPVSITLVPTGICLRFDGVAGRSYTIQRAHAVTGPWNILATPTAPLGGLIEYVDTNPPATIAFYRTRTP
jgi:outer membrane protein assembly factor BamB